MVQRDPVDPRVDLGLLPETREILEDFDEDFLRQVSRGLFVLHEMEDEIEDATRVGGVDFRKRGAGWSTGHRYRCLRFRQMSDIFVRLQ